MTAVIDNGDIRRFQITAYEPVVVYADRIAIAENGSTVLVVDVPNGEDLIVGIVSAASQVLDLLAVEGAAPAPGARPAAAKVRAPKQLTEHTPETGT